MIVGWGISFYEVLYKLTTNFRKILTIAENTRKKNNLAVGLTKSQDSAVAWAMVGVLAFYSVLLASLSSSSFAENGGFTQKSG
jgi:hypothetical protein